MRVLILVLLLFLGGCGEDHSRGYCLQWRYIDGLWLTTCYCGAPLVALDEHDAVVCTDCGRYLVR